MEENNFKDEANCPYTQVPNDFLYDPRLSLKAKGLWAYMHAKPKDWFFAADRIALETKDSPDAVRSGLKELIEFGFLVAKRESSGRFMYILKMPLTSVKKEPHRENADKGSEPNREKAKKGKSQIGNFPMIINKEDNKKRVKQIGEFPSGLESRPSGTHKPYRSDFENQEDYVKALYAWQV